MNALREIGHYMIQTALMVGWFGGILFLYCTYVLTANGVLLW